MMAPGALLALATAWTCPVARVPPSSELSPAPATRAIAPITTGEELRLCPSKSKVLESSELFSFNQNFYWSGQ